MTKKKSNGFSLAAIFQIRDQELPEGLEQLSPNFLSNILDTLMEHGVELSDGHTMYLWSKSEDVAITCGKYSTCRSIKVYRRREQPVYVHIHLEYAAGFEEGTVRWDESVTIPEVLQVLRNAKRIGKAVKKSWQTKQKIAKVFRDKSTVIEVLHDETPEQVISRFDYPEHLRHVYCDGLSVIVLSDTTTLLSAKYIAMTTAAKNSGICDIDTLTPAQNKKFRRQVDNILSN